MSLTPIIVNRKLLGAKGEDVAAGFLTRKGFRILERNYRSRLGEVDLVCQDRGAVVFVEVKTRTSSGFAPPLASVGPRKRAKLRRLAAEYVISRRRESSEIRFDVLSIVLGPGKPEIEHIPGAF